MQKSIPRRADGARQLARAVALALMLPSSVLTPLIADDSPETNEPVGTWAHDSSASLRLALLSRYVWRGQLFTDGPVIEPEVEVRHRGFLVNVWSNLDLDDVNGNEREVNEIDLTFGYSHDFELASLSGGLIHYTFPSTLFEDTTELFASAAFNVLLHPTASVYSAAYSAIVGGELRDAVVEPDNLIAGLSVSYGF